MTAEEGMGRNIHAVDNGTAMFETVTEEEAQAVVTALILRHRKVLSFRSPYEVFFSKAKF